MILIALLNTKYRNYWKYIYYNIVNILIALYSQTIRITEEAQVCYPFCRSNTTRDTMHLWLRSSHVTYFYLM